MPEIHIGTSGWYYNHWVGSFYPEDTNSGDFFNYYTKNFDTLEINNTFYRLPSDKTLNHWLSQTPEDFVYSFKASRYITHMKKLKDPMFSTFSFFEKIKLLEDKIGPVLFQLPPYWGVDSERLGVFVKGLPENYRYVFEFRDKSWINQEVKQILEDNNCAFCIYHLEGYLTPKWVTADFVYIRLHGPEKVAYKGKYSEKDLKAWAEDIKKWEEEGKDVFCYFDNDEKGYAPINAKELKELLS